MVGIKSCVGGMMIIDWSYFMLMKRLCVSVVFVRSFLFVVIFGCCFCRLFIFFVFFLLVHFVCCSFVFNVFS